MVWAAFDKTTGRRYVSESNVPSSVIDIGATLAQMINDNEDLYTLVNCHLFNDRRLIGLGYYEAYGTRTMGLTF